MVRSEEAKGRELEEKAEKEKEKKELVEKVQREDRKPLYDEDERRKERKGRQEESPTPTSETDPGEDWEVALSNWLCVSAAAEGPQRRTEAMVRMQQEVQVKGGRWADEIPQRWRQPKGEDRTEMMKEAKLLRCTLLDGSA